jgi:serine/threonine-protein kinase
MSRKPEDRYATTLAMKADLEAYLENRVVRAYETGVAAELRKWTLRNKALAAAIGLVVLSTVSGLAYNQHKEAENGRTLEKKNKELQTETTRATAAAETSKAVVDFLTNMFRSQDPGNSRGETLTVKQALAEATKQIDPSFKSKPEVKAYVLQSIGQVYMSLSLYDEAEPMLENSLALYRALPSGTTLEMLVAINSLGVQRMVHGDVAGARAYFEEEIALAERDFGVRSEEALKARFHLVHVSLEERKFDEAESLCLQNVAQRRAEGEAKAADLADALQFLATTYSFEQRPAQAEDALTEAIALRERIGPADDAALLGARWMLGSHYQSQHRYDEARRIYESVLELQRKKLADDDPDVLTTRWLIAGLLEAQGQLAEAESLYAEVHAGRVRKLGEQSGLTSAALQSLVAVRNKRVALEQLAQEQAHSLESLRASLAPDDPQIADLARKLIDSYLKLGRPQDALPLARELAERAEPGSAAASERRALLDRVEQAIRRN